MLCPARPRPAPAGFSLIELLTVVVVIGLLAAIALPAIDVERARVNAAVASVATVLQAAQREAVVRQHDVRVSLDAAGRRLEILRDANNNGTADAGERVSSVALEDGVVFGRAGAAARAFGAATVSFAVPNGATLPAVTFHRNGAASEAGGFYLTSAKAAAGSPRRVADTRALEVIRATGRVEWFRWDGTTWIRGS